jgi:predicted DsbA family dithiol-disulfide isomerase
VHDPRTPGRGLDEERRHQAREKSRRRFHTSATLCECSRVAGKPETDPSIKSAATDWAPSSPLDAGQALGLHFAPVKVTYYLEVLSSWCHWVEPVWAELKSRYAGRAEFEWRIALMHPGDFPVSRNQCDWFYRRSGGTVMNSPVMLNSAWFEEGRKGVYDNASLAAEAGRDFGFSDDTIRLALTRAALVDGLKIGDMAVAAAVASKAAGIAVRKFRARAESAEVRSRVEASTAVFHSHQITQRPAFILEDEIGDKAVFSGIVRIGPLAAAIDAMLSDTAAYAAHKAHHGVTPKK